MKHALFSRILSTGLLAVAAVAATPAAQARPDGPVFVAPPMVSTAPPGFDRHHGPYDAAAWRSPHRAEFERERAWRHAEWERHEWQRREWERREAYRHGWGHRGPGRGRD